MAKKILVIDDEGLVTKSLEKLLLREGYSVVIAQSGKEAIERVKGSSFDLIVCDVRMPGIDGVDTVKQIRKLQKETKRKPASELIITGYTDETSYNRVLELKVANYILKPFDTRQFLEAVKKSLKQNEK